MNPDADMTTSKKPHLQTQINAVLMIVYKKDGHIKGAVSEHDHG